MPYYFAGQEGNDNSITEKSTAADAVLMKTL